MNICFLSIKQFEDVLWRDAIEIALLVGPPVVVPPPRKAFFWFGFMLGDPHTRVGIPRKKVKMLKVIQSSRI